MVRRRCRAMRRSCIASGERSWAARSHISSTLSIQCRNPNSRGLAGAICDCAESCAVAGVLFKTADSLSDQRNYHTFYDMEQRSGGQV